MTATRPALDCDPGLQLFRRKRIFIGMETPRFLSGKLLLAMPGIGDPRFERAVIAMCVHDENGAVGIGIGHQRAGIGVRGLLEQLGLEAGKAPDGPVLHGGPVEPGRALSSTATIGVARTRSKWSALGRLPGRSTC